MATRTGRHYPPRQGRLYMQYRDVSKSLTHIILDPCRSPWSNEYDPELPDGATPNATLRKLEVHANEAFDTYREMYYEGGVSSVYTFEIEDKFAIVVLIKKGKLIKGSGFIL